MVVYDNFFLKVESEFLCPKYDWKKNVLRDNHYKAIYRQVSALPVGCLRPVYTEPSGCQSKTVLMIFAFPRCEGILTDFLVSVSLCDSALYLDIKAAFFFAFTFRALLLLPDNCLFGRVSSSIFYFLSNEKTLKHWEFFPYSYEHTDR